MRRHFSGIKKDPRLHSGLRKGLQVLFCVDLSWHGSCVVWHWLHCLLTAVSVDINVCFVKHNF